MLCSDSYISEPFCYVTHTQKYITCYIRCYMMIMINFVPPLASVLGQLHLLHHHQPVPLTRQAARAVRAGPPGAAPGSGPPPGS